MKTLTKSALAVTMLVTVGFAQTANSAESLTEKRQQVITNYINYLANADLEGMQTIFSANSTVVSTSAGEKNALAFFAGFFPLIDTAHTELHHRFISMTDANRYGGRFHLDYQLSDGDRGEGEYVDEFLFYDNSDKLKSVYMFENLKFPK